MHKSDSFLNSFLKRLSHKLKIALIIRLPLSVSNITQHKEILVSSHVYQQYVPTSFLVMLSVELSFTYSLRLLIRF